MELGTHLSLAVERHTGLSLGRSHQRHTGLSTGRSWADQETGFRSPETGDSDTRIQEYPGTGVFKEESFSGDNFAQWY